MKIISEELGEWDGPEENLPILMRVIHTTADFEYVKNLKFSQGAVSIAREAIKNGVTIVTDTNMAAAGINKRAASQFGVEVVCRMAEKAIREKALEAGTTRAVASIDEAVRLTPEAIFAIGNAPTALIRLCEHIRTGRAKPSLVIGVPVGFVNVTESKEILIRTEVPYIAAMGRKGGSPVASAIVNAILYGLR